MNDDIVFVKVDEPTVIIVKVDEPTIITTPGAQGPQGIPGILDLNHDVTLIGTGTITEPLRVNIDAVDRTYVYEQMVPCASWGIVHNLGKYASVTVIDTGGNVVYGDINYLNLDSIIINFSAPFSGKAYLN